MVPDQDTVEGEETTSRTEVNCCKVGRTATEMGMADILTEVANRRKAGDSLRDLTAYFNIRVVERTLERSAIDTNRSVYTAIIGDDLAEEIYKILRGRQKSDIRRAELRTRLSNQGVNVERLDDLFVSHVTIRSHLQECANVELPESAPPFEKIINTTRGAQNRASNIIQSTLNRAVRQEQIQTGPLETEVPVRITCMDCGDMFYLTELLDAKKCSCEASTSQ